MSAKESAAFISRLVGLPVVDVAGDQVGRVKDVVFHLRTDTLAPRVHGLVVELFARQRISVPMIRVHNITVSQAAILGRVDTRRSKKRETEWLVAADLLGRPVPRDVPTRIYDVSMIQVRNREWELFQTAITSRTKASRFGLGGRRVTDIIQQNQVPDLVLATGRSLEHLMAKFSNMKSVDIVQELHNLDPDRLVEVIKAPDDETLAEALEELSGGEQVQLISKLETNRAIDALAETDSDDVVDLIKDFPEAVAENLLEHVEPGDASDVRRLLVYGGFIAGGMMTPELVVLGTDATMAEALVRIHEEQSTPVLTSTVFVTRPSLETPSSRHVGTVHFQQLLRAAPTLMVVMMTDHNLEPLGSDSSLVQVSRPFAIYSLVVAPAVDSDGTPVGTVTVDDIPDHMLPDDWRGAQMDGPVEVSHG